MFVDDFLLFTKAKSSQVRLVWDVLQKNCDVSGLKINIQKPKFMTLHSQMCFNLRNTNLSHLYVVV